MELGEKLLRARQEAGLSQRQLCGEEITRNMLSQIEHGTARPSMDTLKYLAARLGKPVSWFLEEDAVTSPNQQAMADARKAFDGGNWEAAMEALEAYREPDTVFDRERQLLAVLVRLALGEKALAEDRKPYARELLEQPVPEAVYCSGELERRRLLLLGQLQGENLQLIRDRLPSLDAELLLRGEAALQAGDMEKAARLLDAAEDRNGPRWCFLRGEVYLCQARYQDAARCYHGAETAYPKETAQRLERCYRELEDFKQAYFYACRRR